MDKKEPIIVGISIGDLNGIGPEIILKAFEDSRVLELCTPIVFANVKLLSFLKKHFELNVFIHGIDQLQQALPGKLNVLNVWKDNFIVDFGKESPESGKLAIQSFTEATKALKENQIDVLVTAPIHKYNSQSDGFKFAGHTGYLQQELEGTALMLLISNHLRVGLLTEHVPVAEVAKHITPQLIKNKVAVLKKSLQQDFKINQPKIAILGLNPHCGDQGVIGNEDDTIIKPTIAELFDQGTYVFGPYASDSFFGNQTYQKFDAILACYHDQGLIPFKTISFGEGVNFTAGLNKIRTSPDHGTGFDIAGKNEAKADSFLEAIYAAIDLYHARAEYLQLSENPLKIVEKQLESKKMN